MSAALVGAAAAIAAAVVVAPAFQKYRKGERLKAADKVRVIAAAVIVLAAATWAIYRARPKPAPVPVTTKIPSAHSRIPIAPGGVQRIPIAPGGAPYTRTVAVEVPEPPPSMRMYGGEYRPFDAGVVDVMTPELTASADALAGGDGALDVTPDFGASSGDVGTYPVDAGASSVDVGASQVDVGASPVDVGAAPVDVAPQTGASVTVDGDALVLEGFEL